MKRVTVEQVVHQSMYATRTKLDPIFGSKITLKEAFEK